MSTLVIGVTGKLCAGKSVVAGLLSEAGLLHIDVDRLGHLALISQRSQIISRFGGAILGHDSQVDRAALGRLVFADPLALSALEALVHPAMVAMVRTQISESPNSVAINAALLYKMGLHHLCDAVFHVTAPAPLRLLRAMRRDRRPMREVLRRMARQRGEAFNPRRRQVDTYIVGNVASLRRLRRRVARLLARLSGRDGA